MPAAEVLAALLAMAARVVEPAYDGPAGDLGLERLLAAVCDASAATVGTVVGQWRLEGFIDLGGRRRFAMGVPAVSRARLAARLLGVLFRFPFGEGSGLPFGGAFRCVEPLLQGADRLLQQRDLRADEAETDLAVF